MKNIPDKIYLQIGDETPKSVDFKDLDEVTWCADRISENDIEYVRVKKTDLKNTNKQTIMENNKNTTELTPLMVAEKEMKDKAIEAHRKLCPYLDDEICAGQSDVVTSSKIDEKCLGKCEYVELFKLLIMKKLLFLLLLISTSISAQIEKVDTVINEKCYTSYYNYKIKAPDYVVYKLYKGGGNVSRKGMSFKSKLPHFAYPKSWYDIGHMANAEDFAYNRELQESTFRYYNALPQTPNLNRGIWKVLETKVRKYSQKDSLLIICGGIEFNNLVPAKCFKVVYSLSTGKILYSTIFTNKQADNSQTKFGYLFDFNKLRKQR